MGREMGKSLRVGFAALLVATVIAGFCGCNGGSSSESSNDTGEVFISMTDAEGDFVTYTVDVLSLTLEKANGAVVETMPVTTTVDFAQYTDLTEFLTAATVPDGFYVSASVRLDYTNADIRVENADGDTVQVTNIVDMDGESVEILELTVELKPGQRLFVAPGVPAHLMLDFDLEMSNAVTFDDEGVPTVTVDSVLTADMNVEESKIHRVRGTLDSVDTAGSSFGVVIRPFVHLLSGGQGDFGVLTVLTDESTVYDIDGEPYEGAAGLEQLELMPALTAVVALGDLKLNPVRFEAREVRAGSSVPGGTMDVVTGNVISRTGDVIMVKGASLMRAGGSAVFNDTVAITLADTTVVRRQLSLVPYTIDDVSVGQRLSVFGTITNDDVESLEMDASKGYAHMVCTTLGGLVVGEPETAGGESTVVMEVNSIDLRGVDVFDFTGTGATAEDDADPQAYDVDAGTINVSGLEDGTRIRVKGFVTPFGQAPADFEAQSITDVSAVGSVIRVTWGPATATAFSELGADGMTLDLTGCGLLHHLMFIGGTTDLLGLPESPVIAPAESGLGLFVIGQNGTLRLYLSFNNFVQDLQDRLDSGLLVKSVVARGSFDDATGTMTAGIIAVGMRHEGHGVE